MDVSLRGRLATEAIARLSLSKAHHWGVRMRLPRLRLALTDGFGYVSPRHCVSDCHPFAEFILSGAEGLWASAYFVARNDDVTTTNASGIVIQSQLVDHPLSASIERGALGWSRHQSC